MPSTRMGRTRAAAAMAAVAVVAAACSSGTRSSATETPRPGGVLRIGIVRPASLDPALARSPDQLLVASFLFTAPTTLDAGTSEVRPGVASHWSSSADQRHWDFALTRTAHFADGRTVTAADVKYTLERIAAKGSRSAVLFGLAHVSGFKAFAVDGTAIGLSGVTTPATDRVHFDLDQPDADLPAILANPAFGIVPREAVESHGPGPAFADRPTGNGMWVLADRTSDRLHLTPAGTQSGYLDAIDISLFGDEASAYAAFRAGQLDVSPLPRGNVAGASGATGATGAIGATHVVTHAYLAEEFYGFNFRDPKLDNSRLREAVVKAVDATGIIDAAYGASARPFDGVVPDGVPGHQSDPCGVACRSDRDAARALLVAAYGTVGSPALAIDYDTSATDRVQQQVAQALAADLQAVGITVSLRPHPAAEYTGFLATGKQEVFRLGWVAAFARPDAFLEPLFRSAMATNLTGFASPTVDGLLTAARSGEDEGARLRAAREAERRVLAAFPVLPIGQVQLLSAVAPTVRGLTFSALGVFDASTVWLAAKA